MVVPSLTVEERQRLFADIAAVPDPEVPVLTIEDLGVLRSIEEQGGRIVVTLTPTYSGCPAMRYMEDQVRDVLRHAGVEGEVRTVLSPAWTTDWMSEAGRTKLEAYGIAPPPEAASAPPEAASIPGTGAQGGAVPVWITPTVRCPRCRSLDTAVVSEFGSTACKALYRCLACLEPFDHFKGL